MLTTSGSPATLCFDPSVIGPWVCEKAGGTWIPGRGQAIGQVKDGQINAGVLYEDWNGANIVCHIRGDGGWANRRFLNVIFDYPFNQLKVRRITVPVSSANQKSRKLVEHMGFSLESVLAQATPEGDLLLYRMFKEECKFIKGKYHGQVQRSSST